MKPDAEQRRAPRRRAASPIPVTNTITERMLGQLGNLSATGLMLLGPGVPPHGAVYQVAFTLRDAQHRERRIDVGIQEQWHEPAASAGRCWSGYRIVAASDDDLRVIDEWTGSSPD